MKIVRTEHHQVNSEFTYDIPEEDIAEAFGSVTRFEEIISHSGDGWNTPRGDEPTDEELETFYEFIEGYDYDRYDDWWTDRKGGYDVSYKVEGSDSNDNDSDDDYDSDEEVLH
jgi:hypothetical protein